MFKTLLTAAVVAGSFIVGSAAQAAMLNFDFYRVPVEGAPGNSAIDASSQLEAEATMVTGGVEIDFSVLPGLQPNASITEIYFSDMGGLFVPPPQIVFESAGVSFETNTINPPDLPGGNNATPSFTVTSGLIAQADGNNATGINIGELLTLKLVFDTGYDWAQFVEDVNDGSFRIGLHVRSLAGGESDAFVSMPQVPLPAGGLLLLTALAGAGAVARRRKTA